MKLKNIAIIPARGGSKRIPRKNIKLFANRPIISYAINAALNSNCFTEVMVSTDDEEIAQIALGLGAKVPFMRSQKNSDDFATTASVLKEVIEEYKKIKINFDNLCCIYPATPLIDEKIVAESYEFYIKTNSQSMFTVIKNAHPIQRSLTIESNGFLNLKSEKARK